MFSFLSTFSMCTQLRFCVRVATRLADLYTCKFDKFRKNSSRNVLLAIDYLPFYIMFFNISVLFRCNTKQWCCVALSICTKSWFIYGISWFILHEMQSKMILHKQPILFWSACPHPPPPLASSRASYSFTICVFLVFSIVLYSNKKFSLSSSSSPHSLQIGDILLRLNLAWWYCSI